MQAQLLNEIEGIQNLQANDLAKKTNILDAVHLLAISWDWVFAQMIRKCFGHAGFCGEKKKTRNLKKL